MILVNVKIDTSLLRVGLKVYAHSAGAWSDDLIRRDIFDSLHYFYDPFPKVRFVRQVIDLQCNIEICFHGDEVRAPIRVDTILTKCKDMGLCFWLKPLNGLLKITGEFGQILICPLISTILGVGWWNCVCTLRTLVDVGGGQGSDQLWRR